MPQRTYNVLLVRNIEPHRPTSEEGRLIYTITLNVDPEHREAMGDAAIKRLNALGELAVDGIVTIYENTLPISPHYREFQKYQQKQTEIAQITACLTQREQDVAQLLAQGLTNNEIAQQLFVEPSTVKSHIARMFDKTGIRNRGQLGALLLGIHPKDWEVPKRQPSPAETGRTRRKL